MNVSMLCTVHIDIDDGLCPDVITRCTENTTAVNGLGESQGWRDTFYPLETEDQVYEHLAFNCLVNGVTDITRLDGWADVPEDAVRMWVDRSSVEAEDIWRMA